MRERRFETGKRVHRRPGDAVGVLVGKAPKHFLDDGQAGDDAIAIVVDFVERQAAGTSEDFNPRAGVNEQHGACADDRRRAFL